MKYFGVIFSFTIFFFCIAPPPAFAAKQLSVSVVDSDLIINSCNSELPLVTGYKGYVDGVQVLSSAISGGFACFGSVFLRNMPLFLENYPKPLHFYLDFYADVSFVPPVFAHADLYYDGSQFTYGNSSVLFLPGVEASRLYEQRLTCVLDCEDQLWEPNGDSDTRALFLDSNGKSLDDSIYTRDVIDEAYAPVVGPNIYKSFLQMLEGMKSSDHSIVDYSVVPYDWRLSLDDILSGGMRTGDNISYLSTVTEPYIISEIMRLASTSQTGKVTIVAHSNGGLVAKSLLKKLADENNPLLARIDKLILVAVPQIGTPEAVAGLLHGYNQGIPASFPLTLSEHTAREFGHNMPGAYNFLPSDKYFTYVDTPIVTFDSTAADWQALYGEEITSQSALRGFLTDIYGRVDSSSEDTDTPDSLSSSLLSASEAEHSSLDTWTPPNSLQVTEIAGWGVPTTVAGITYAKVDDVIRPEPQWTIDGDGTVVVPSALYSNSGSERKYWVDLKSYNSFLNEIRNLRLATKHAGIFEVEGLRTFIKNLIISGSSTSLPTYISESSPVASSDDTRLIYTLYTAPDSSDDLDLDLDIYDTRGNHTGISTTTNKVEENISGTYFVKNGKTKYIFTEPAPQAQKPPPVKVKVTTKPKASLSQNQSTSTPKAKVTVVIKEVKNNTIVATTTFANIPLSTSTVVSLDVVSDITTPDSVSPLLVDDDGDGITDVALPSILNGTAIYIPPAVSQSQATSTDSNATTTDQTIPDDDAEQSQETATSTPQIAHDSGGTATTTTDHIETTPQFFGGGSSFIASNGPIVSGSSSSGSSSSSVPTSEFIANDLREQLVVLIQQVLELQVAMDARQNRENIASPTVEESPPRPVSESTAILTTQDFSVPVSSKIGTAQRSEFLAQVISSGAMGDIRRFLEVTKRLLSLYIRFNVIVLLV